MSATGKVTQHQVDELRLAFEWHDGSVVEPPRRDRWADMALARLTAEVPGPLPAYGSPDWQNLPDGHPHRWASVIAAAEAWRSSNTLERIAADLKRELAGVDRQTHERLRSTSADVCSAKDWHRIAEQPTYAELQRRRAIPVVPQPRRRVA